MAASATFALKVGVWFRRGRLFMVSPDFAGHSVPAVRQKLHLSPRSDFRDQLYAQVPLGEQFHVSLRKPKGGGQGPPGDSTVARLTAPNHANKSTTNPTLGRPSEM